MCRSALCTAYDQHNQSRYSFCFDISWNVCIWAHALWTAYNHFLLSFVGAAPADKMTNFCALGQSLCVCGGRSEGVWERNRKSGSVYVLPVSDCSQPCLIACFHRCMCVSTFDCMSPCWPWRVDSLKKCTNTALLPFISIISRASFGYRPYNVIMELLCMGKHERTKNVMHFFIFVDCTWHRSTVLAQPVLTPDVLNTAARSPMLLSLKL